MITVRNADDRGTANFGWLQSQHSFSFGSYFDPGHVGFGPLRVINEDRVRPGAGFDTHGHRDMEIISYVLDGALEHKDSTGSGSVIRPGDIQRMTAGSGILHSEYNHSRESPVHFLQIWIHPAEKGLAPGYEQMHFEHGELSNRLRLVIGPEGGDGVVKIHQDARVYASKLDAGSSVDFTPENSRGIWIQLARGSVTVNGVTLTAGDGASLVNEAELTITAADDAELLFFDLPMNA